LIDCVQVWTRITKSKKRSKKAQPKKVPQSVIDVLRSKPEDGCNWCGGSEACSVGCYRAFRKQCKENASKVDIRGPGQIGYGAYTKPDATIAKGQYLDEYFGTILPMPRTGRSIGSRYVFEHRNFCIDAEEAGKWTRYVNSACQPNVVASDTHIGGRYVLVFQSSKNITEDEQLYIDYGRDYFVNAGIMCTCSGLRRPHVPKYKSQRKKGSSKR